MFKTTTVTFKPVRQEPINLLEKAYIKIDEVNELFKLINTINQVDLQLENQIQYKKNKEFLYTNCNTIKRRFYHYRDINKHPRITVCILQTPSKIYSRGISLCSFLDQPVKAEGRDRAENRAITALKGCETSDRISRFEARDLIEYFPEFMKEIKEEFKSAYNVQPTTFELRLFNPLEVKE